MGSSPNVILEKAKVTPKDGWLFRILAALVLGLGMMVFLAATSWAKYSEKELRSVETEKERQIRTLRDYEIKELRELLGRRFPKNRRADLYFRLAEINLEAYRTQFLLEGRVHDKKLRSGNKKAKLDRGGSRAYLRAGIKACQQILDLKIRYPKMDRVYYFLAFNNGELGKQKTSERYYKQLLKRFPKSRFRVEAYRELGEAAFRARNYKRAQGYLESALKEAKEPPPGILHKLSWSYYRTRQFERAVSTMKRAIKQASKDDERFLSIREEALRDMAIFMTESGQVDEALRYFKQVAGNTRYFPRTLEKLAREYERRLQRKKAVAVYRAMLATDLNDDLRFRTQFKLFELELQRFRYTEAAKFAEAAQAPKNPSDTDTEIAITNLKVKIRKTATQNHDSYRKAKKKRTKKSQGYLNVARQYYALYLKKYFSEKLTPGESAEIGIYLAEVLKAQGNLDESAKWYKRVLDSEDPKFSQKAGVLWISTLADVVKKKSKNRKRGDSPSPSEREFISATDRLQDALPNTTTARKAYLEATQVLAGYKKTRPQAISRTKRITTKWPSTQEAHTAALLRLQILEDDLPQITEKEADEYLAKNARLIEAIGDLRSNKKLIAYDKKKKKRVLSKRLDILASQGQTASVLAYEKKGNLAEASRLYLSLAEGTKQRKKAEVAYQSAIATNVKNNDLKGAAKAQIAWLKRYPNKKAIDSTRSLATNLLIQGYFLSSARLFVLLGRSSKQPNFVETAALIFNGNGNTKEAIDAYGEHLRRFPKSKERFRIMLDLAQIYEREGKTVKAIQAYSDCSKGTHLIAAECFARQGDLHLAGKDTKKARKSYQRASKSKAKKRRNRSAFVGYARFKLARLLEDTGKFEPLRMPEDVLKKSLETRLSYFDKLNRAYQSAVDAGGPWSIAALYRLSKWTLDFAKEVDDIDPPKKVDPEVLNRFQKTLESVSKPLRTQAVEALRLAYKKSVEGEVLSPSVPEVADLLADLGASYPARAQGARGLFRVGGISPKSGANSLKQVRDRLLKNPRNSDAWVDYGNLLWGKGKSLLSQVAYERAITLNQSNSKAHNNLALVLLSDEGQEDWIKAARAMGYLKTARKRGRSIDARFNIASLQNYYRLFKKARPNWEAVVKSTPTSDALDGLAIAQQGLGKFADAESTFKKANKKTSSDDRFSYVYHLAARRSEDGQKGAEDCLEEMGDLSGDVRGFEKQSKENLERICRQWKGS